MNKSILPSIPKGCSLVASACLLLSTALLADTPPTQALSDGTQVRKFSPVPAPGVHPRIFLSPEDLPTLREAAKSPARKAFYEALRKRVAEGLDNPITPEGKVMALIKEGKTPSDAQFAACTEFSYQLALAGIDAQIADDKARGELLGKALSAWGVYEMKNWVRKPDPIGLHNSFDTMTCLAYDFIAPSMSEKQRKPVRQFIAKMSDGIDIYTWDKPAHWRMWNWSGLHDYQGWGSLAIEGEPGYKPHLWDQAKVVARDFCTYNIHPSGALTEDITYFSLGFQGSGLVLTAMAKRGEPEALGAGSNLKQLKYHLINQLEPWGTDFMSHQDGGGNGFYTTWTILKNLYPTDPVLDVAWRNRVGEDYGNQGAGNDAGTRAWVAVLFNNEYLTNKLSPADLKLPDTYFCPVRGYMIARTGWDTNALKLDFEAKQDYPVVGHNHADANNFTLAALGREWATEVGYHAAAGHLHNNVLVDGRSEAPWPTPGGEWIDFIDSPDITIGVSDAKHPYDYRWSASAYGVGRETPPANTEKWEKETCPSVAKFFAGEENRTKPTIFEHYGPILRAIWNPVERAFRTAALVRGKHPYILIVDDVKKDDSTHLYEWAMQMPEDVEVIKSGGNWMVLGAKNYPPDPKAKGADAKPQPDKRRLLVQIVDAAIPQEKDGMSMRLEATVADNDAFSSGKLRKRLVIPSRSVDPQFKVLLYPFIEGTPMPDVRWNDEHTACDIIFPDQADHYRFMTVDAGRTVYAMSRNDQPVATIKAAPAAPLLLSKERVFTDHCKVELALPGPDQEIRYTLDGSEPKPDSEFYTGPVTLDKSATLKAATFARRWDFGDQRRSSITETKFSKEAPRDAVTLSKEEPGVNVVVYDGFWNELPDFTKEKPKFETVTDRFVLPPGTPAKGFGMLGSSYIRVPADGVYTFALKCDDPGKLWIDDQLVVDHDGPHVVQTRSGEIALRAGLHKIVAANCDSALLLGKGKGDGSWAFEVLWAPSGAALSEISPDLLSREPGKAVAIRQQPTVPAKTDLVTEPGLEYASYDRTAETNKLSFLEVSGAKPLEQGIRPNTETPDSSPNLLHLCRGYLSVTHPGVYEFRLDANGIGEVSLGDTVVSRVGFPDGNVSQPVTLGSGLIPYTVKLAKGSGLVRWKGPGQDWQPITPEDVVREVRPLVTIKGLPQGAATYELNVPTQVQITTGLPAEGKQEIRYTLDGSEPTLTSQHYEAPFTIDKNCKLRARIFSEGKPVGVESSVAFTHSQVPTLGLLGVWSASKTSSNAIVNQIEGKAGDLPIPVGTVIQDDPEQGKVFVLDHSAPIILSHPAILENQLTLVFRIQPTGPGSLIKETYGPKGLFADVTKELGLHAGGGGSYNVVQSEPNILGNKAWHTVTATFGGKPVRSIALYLDGKEVGSGKTPVPCLQPQLTLLPGFNGKLSEIRLYNRILTPDEIKALAKP